MTPQEKNRIGLLDKIKNDSNKIKVSDVAELFSGIMFMYFTKTQTGAAVKAKLTEGEYTKFLHGISNTFLSSLYVSASNSQTEFKQRLEYVENVNKDLLVKKEVDA